MVLTSMLFLATAGLPACGKKNKVTGIAIELGDPFIAKGTLRKLYVMAQLSHGLPLTMWTQVTWQTDNPAVATISSAGVLTAVEAGTAVITATDMAHPSFTSSATVYVTDLQAITVVPALVSIPVGSVQFFTATGTYSGLTLTYPSDLTPLVSWASSSTDVAVISNVTPSQGIATASTTTTGTTTITATILITGTTVTPITGTATLTVVP